MNKLALGAALITPMAIYGCAEDEQLPFKDLSAEVRVVVTETDENYIMEYIFEVENKGVTETYVGMTMDYNDEKMKNLFPDEIGVSEERNESGVEYKQVNAEGQTRFDKLIVIPKETFSTLAEAQSAAKKIKYRITNGEAIKEYSNS